MADTSTQKYASTINGQIARITAASDLLAAKVTTFGLAIPATTDAIPTTVATGTGTVSATSYIEDVAAALNQANVQTQLAKSSSSATTYLSGDQELSANSSIYIPVGYNKTAFTVKAKNSYAGTATAGMVIKDATALSKDGPITGTLVLDPTKILTTQSWTAADGTPKTGSIETRTPSAIISGDTATDNTIIVDVEVLTAAGEDLVSGGELPAGYYPQPVQIYPRYKSTTGNNRINVQASKTASQTNHASVTPDSGFDFLSKVVVPDAATPALSITDKASTDLTPGTKSGDYYPFTTSLDGTLSVGTAGWISTSGLSATDSSVTVGRIKASTHTSTSATDNKYGGSTAVSTTPTAITGQYFKDVLTAGYTPSDSTTYYKVQDAKTATLSINSNAANEVTVGAKSGDYYALTADLTGKTTFGTAGWIGTSGLSATQNGVAVGKIPAGTHTIGNLLKADTAIGTNVAANHYYVKCDTTTGYQTASTTYIDLGVASTHTISAVTKQGSTAGNGVAANSYYVKCTSTAGYTPGDTQYKDLGVSTHGISAVTAQGTTASNGVAANSYYVKCTSTKGYTEGETVYKDLGASALSTTGVTYDATNKAFVASATTTAGYTTGKTVNATAKTITEGSGATLTTNADSKSITANTYYPSAATVSVSSTTAEIKGKSGSNTGVSTTTALGNLTADTTFTNSDKKFFSSFTVDVADIIADLKAI